MEGYADFISEARFIGEGALPTPPAGFVFLVDDDGSYLIDEDGNYLMEAA